tara:strand:+ start:607 stop:771 length:165 start_codon:yes stop_codon:yes gene_type:complete
MTPANASYSLQYCNKSYAAPLFLPYCNNKIVQTINAILQTIHESFNIANNGGLK